MSKQNDSGDDGDVRTGRREGLGGVAPDPGADAGYRVISETHPRWLLGSGRCQFRASYRIGMGGVHDLPVDLSPEEVQQAADALRAVPDAARYYLRTWIPRGKARQWIQIAVPRAMLIGIADAIAGAVDSDDAGHRFWHWSYPDSARPCSGCHETIDRENARATIARAELVERWAFALGTEESQVELLLAQYEALPRRVER